MTNEQLIEDLQRYLDAQLSGELPVRIKIEVIAKHGDRNKISTRVTKVAASGDYQWSDASEIL